MTVNEYINKFQATKRDSNAAAAVGQPDFVLGILNEHIVIPPLECTDGFHISVQASSGHYCEPRNSQGPWTAVECGFPSADVPELAEYKDGNNVDTESVFAYVPVEIVEAVVAKHGGMKITADAIEECSALITRLTGAKHD